MRRQTGDKQIIALCVSSIAREVFACYQEALADLPGIEFMPEAPYGKSNRWLTVILITHEEFGADREAVRLALEAENIESRPV